MKKKNLRFVCLLVIILLGKVSYSQTLKGIKFLDEYTSSDSAMVFVFADGNVKGLVSNTENNQTSTTGAIGISVIKKNITWNASINIASTIDTLNSDFGSIILNPSSGKQFTSGLLEFYARNLIKKYNIGFHGYASGSSSNWSKNDTTKAASIFGLGALMTYDIVNSSTGENEIAFGFEFGPSYRGVFGNISNDEQFYENILGTKGQHFLGLEGGLNIRFNHITAGIQGYLLYDVEQGHKIDGVTSFQITGGISISGSIFKSKVKL